VERLPFSVEKAVNTPYKHDAFQPLYLVSESLDETIAEVLGLSPSAAARRCPKPQRRL
jgi:phenylalanine-4-hydroxylase